MHGNIHEGPAECYCLAIRQAARHVSQFYDQVLASAGLRGTQYSILSRLQRSGPLTINELAGLLVMDRTTLGRNIRPLEREGLLAVAQRSSDRRSKELRLTDAGAARLRSATQKWHEAQARFEAVFGSEHSSELRVLMHAVSTADLDGVAARD